MDLGASWPWKSTRTQVVAQTLGFMWPLVASWAMDINTDLGYSNITEPDMVYGLCPELVVTMAPGGSKGHPDGYGQW